MMAACVLTDGELKKTTKCHSPMAVMSSRVMVARPRHWGFQWLVFLFLSVLCFLLQHNSAMVESFGVRGGAASNRCGDQAAINDDFCDCLDGSDEPATSACSGVLAGLAEEERGMLYTCNSSGSSVLKHIPLSQVGDGICDCCDGGDERGGLCKDECFRLQQEHIESMRREHDIGVQGIAAQDGLKGEGKKIWQSWVNSYVEHAAKVERIDAALKVGNEASDEKGRGERDEEHHTNVGAEVAAQWGAITDDGSAEEELASLVKKKVEAKEKLALPTRIVDAGREFLVKDGQPVPKLLANGLITGLQKPGNWNDTESGPWEAAESQNPEYTQLEDIIEKAKRERKEAEKLKLLFHTRIRTLLRQNLMIIGMFGQAVELKSGEYTYSLLPLDLATQKGDTGEVTLGEFSRLSFNEEGIAIMHFENGRACPGKIKRRLSVRLACADKLELESVQETERCVYEGLLLSPAGCSSRRINQLRKILKEHAQPVEDRDL